MLDELFSATRAFAHPREMAPTKTKIAAGRIAHERMSRPSISSPPKPTNFRQMCLFLQMCLFPLCAISNNDVRSEIFRRNQRQSHLFDFRLQVGKEGAVCVK